MAYTEIKFQSPERGGNLLPLSKGRNGAILTTGIAIFKYEHILLKENDIEIYPITSKGVRSDSCFITVPREDIPALIEALQDALECAKEHVKEFADE